MHVHKLNKFLKTNLKSIEKFLLRFFDKSNIVEKFLKMFVILQYINSFKNIYKLINLFY